MPLTHPGPRKAIVLDLDAIDDLSHGQEQLSFFYGFYEEHLYHPFLVFGGERGFPLAAVLCLVNTNVSHRALGVLKSLLKKLRQAYTQALILVRSYAGFAVPALYDYMEEQSDVRCALASSPTPAFLVLAAPPGKVQRKYQRLQRNWTSSSRVLGPSPRLIAKVEYGPLGPSLRFVVTNLSWPPSPSMTRATCSGAKLKTP